jgi:GT2 family glycosyltransferase
MNFKLTVIVPTYKRTFSLKRLLLSLQKQTIAPFLEVLVMDQNEKGFLEKEIGQESLYNVRYIWLNQANASMARNIGGQLASSEYLLFIDDDLVPDEKFCEQGLNIFYENSFIECFSPWVKNDLASTFDNLNLKDRIIEKVTEKLFVISETMSASIFFKRTSFLISGGFDVLLFSFAKTAEDQEFFLRLMTTNIKLYFTSGLHIYHDNEQAGGCELRVVDYWITREKCMKSWVFRHKIQHGGNLELTFSDLVSLYRSVFFNTKGLTSGFFTIIKQIKLFQKVVRDTNNFLIQYRDRYSDYPKVDHFVAKLP